MSILQLDRIQYSLTKNLFSKTTANLFVAGGFITKRLLNEKPNDIDIFFNSRSQIARFLIDARNNLNLKTYYLGKNLIKGEIDWLGGRMKVDIVKRIFEDEKSVIKNFDFTICCFVISRKTYVYHPDAPFDLLSKKLNLQDGIVTFPAGTLMRLQKYVQRDFTYCKGVIRQIMTRIKEDDVEISKEFFYEDGELSFNNID